MSKDPSATLTLKMLAAELAQVKRLEQEHREKIAELDQTNATLRAEVGTLRSLQMADRGPIGTRTKRQVALRTSRRKLLQVGGAAAAATVTAAVLAAKGAPTAHTASARSDTVTFQQNASGDSNIAIEGDGTSGAHGIHGTSDTGFGVLGSSTSNDAVIGISTSGTGVYGSSSSAVGVVGQSSSGTGVTGYSSVGYGAVFAGGLAPLQLGKAATAGAPTGGSHNPGELYVDGSGMLYYCVDSGTPGTWVRLSGVASGASGGATTFLPTPIRLLDSRLGATGAATTPGHPIQPGAVNTFHLSVAGVSYGGVTIPTSAKALVGNCTVVNPAGVGDLAAYPDGLALPNTAVMHYLTGQIVSNGITLGLGTNGKLAITALGSATDVIIDCQGFIA